MKEETVKIVVTAAEVMDKCAWDKLCEMKGWNEWCINEGLMDYDEEISLTEEEAQKLGFIPYYGHGG